MRRFFKYLFIFSVIAIGGYAYRVPLRNISLQLYDVYAPCSRPITYSLGTFDSRFGITKEEFVASIQKAEGIWEKPVGRPLFEYKETGGQMTINLIYDERQEATMKLKALGLTINDDKETYYSLKAEYERLKAQVIVDKDALTKRIASLDARQAAYNKEVTDWNNVGGAPQAEYNRLQSEKNAINDEVTQVKQLQNDVNAEIDKINSLATVLNRIASSLNLNVTTYNNIGGTEGKEFTEGLYTRIAGVQKIDIYQFDSKQKLIKVLAHELGHALGLEHVEDENSIMYRLNTGSKDTLSKTDIAELNRVCHLK